MVEVAGVEPIVKSRIATAALRTRVLYVQIHVQNFKKLPHRPQLDSGGESFYLFSFSERR